MKISIIGAGYVGLVTRIGFTELGHEVVFVDVDKRKVDSINLSEPPIYEKNLRELMIKNKNRYYATTSYEEGLFGTEITFICVGTPSNPDGSINLKFIDRSAISLNHHTEVVLY